MHGQTMAEAYLCHDYSSSVWHTMGHAMVLVCVTLHGSTRPWPNHASLTMPIMSLAMQTMHTNHGRDACHTMSNHAEMTMHKMNTNYGMDAGCTMPNYVKFAHTIQTNYGRKAGRTMPHHAEPHHAQLRWRPQLLVDCARVWQPSS